MSRDGFDESGARLVRLSHLICEEANFLLRSEARDPLLFDVEITRVELRGSCARLWFSGPREAERALERAVGFLRCRLAESLGLKRMPELVFRHDPALREEG